MPFFQATRDYLPENRTMQDSIAESDASDKGLVGFTFVLFLFMSVLSLGSLAPWFLLDVSISHGGATAFLVVGVVFTVIGGLLLINNLGELRRFTINGYNPDLPANVGKSQAHVSQDIFSEFFLHMVQTFSFLLPGIALATFGALYL